MFELFPKQPGIFEGLRHEDTLKSLPSFYYLSQKVEVGEFAGKSSDGFKMCAVVILHHADAAQFARDKAFLDTKVEVRTRSAD